MEPHAINGLLHMLRKYSASKTQAPFSAKHDWGKSINESMETWASPLPLNASKKNLVSLKGLSVPRGADRQDSFAVFTSEAEFLRKQGVDQ